MIKFIDYFEVFNNFKIKSKMANYHKYLRHKRFNSINEKIEFKKTLSHLILVK